MNAPDKDAVLSHISKTLAELQAEKEAVRLAAIHAAQPKVGVDSGATKLLQSEYDHDGLLIDLYGDLDAQFGYEVSDVTLAGNDISIVDLFDHSKLFDFGRWCDRNLPTYHQIQQKAEDDFYAEQRSYA